ncbi:MAG: DNA-processing protein DprA [Muribaculaceae bacterium]|nr:DNA-processing protein DprA [Muribaculaceae bacterium]
MAIVGTRHATPYGLDFVNHFVAELAERLDNLIVVSGLAYGIDVAAHRAALDNNVPTVAVVAHGLNTIYPADHRSTAAKIVNSGGAIVTEYTSDATIHRSNFLARNRIVAGLSDAVIVVESDIKGGALATARIAAAYNREVFAVPGRTTDTYSRGCNDLIASQSASIIRSADDLIETLNWTSRPKEFTQHELAFDMTPEQKSIADYITSHPDHTVNDICIGLGIPFSQLSAMLFEMEMSDMLITLPGGRYAVTAHR